MTLKKLISKNKILKFLYIFLYNPLKRSVNFCLNYFFYYLYKSGFDIRGAQLARSYNYAINNATFKEAFKIKELWMRSLINEQDKRKNLNKYSLKAVVELGDFNKAKKWIDNKNLDGLSTEFLAEIKSFIHLHLGSFEEWSNWASLTSCMEDNSARTKLMSQQVLFLGPAPGADENFINQMKAKFIAFINYTKRSKYDYGNAEVISYYNGQRLLEELDVILNSSLEVSMIFPKPTTLQSFKKAPLIGSKILRGSRTPVNVMLTNHEPNNFQYGLYDLLFLGVRDLCVTGFNFWCSRQAWEQGYKPDNYAHRHTLSISIRAQDPLSNFLFVKNLYNNRLIHLGSDAKKIIDLDIEEYGEILDDLYPISVN